MNIKKHSVKNALIAAIFSSFFAFSSIAGAAVDGDKGRPPDAGTPDNPNAPPDAGSPDNSNAPPVAEPPPVTGSPGPGEP